MRELLGEVREATEKEYLRANEKFPLFHSPHEGFAVLLEEFEEANAERREIETLIKELWDSVMCNDIRRGIEAARRVNTAAKMMAAEAVQVAAMAEKYVGSSAIWTE